MAGEALFARAAAGFGGDLGGVDGAAFGRGPVGLGEALVEGAQRGGQKRARQGRQGTGAADEAEVGRRWPPCARPLLHSPAFEAE